MASIRTIMRKSLGRTAAIGDLYDAATDSFCEKSIFGKLTNLEIETVENPSILINQIYNDESVFNNLIKYDVEPELAFSIFDGYDVAYAESYHSLAATHLIYFMDVGEEDVELNWKIIFHSSSDLVFTSLVKDVVRNETR